MLLLFDCIVDVELALVMEEDLPTGMVLIGVSSARRGTKSTTRWDWVIFTCTLPAASKDWTIYIDAKNNEA